MLKFVGKNDFGSNCKFCFNLFIAIELKMCRYVFWQNYFYLCRMSCYSWGKLNQIQELVQIIFLVKLFIEEIVYAFNRFLFIVHSRICTILRNNYIIHIQRTSTSLQSLNKTTLTTTSTTSASTFYHFFFFFLS